MKKDHLHSGLFSIFIVPIGGLLIMALCYLLYLAIYMFVETMFFANDPTSVPAGMIRNSFAIILLVLYLVLLRTKISDLMKAIIFIGPAAMLIVSVILALYLAPYIAGIFTVGIAGCYIFLLHKNNKPWFYYYATVIAVVAAIGYAWPRA